MAVNKLFLVLITILILSISCSYAPKVGPINTKLCIYPSPNPTISEIMEAFEDSYAKATALKINVVTFYYKLKDLADNLDNDECIIKYLAPLAEKYNLELAIEIEAPEPPGVLNDLPTDIQGLNFTSPTLRDRYISLISGFLDAVSKYDTNHSLKYLFFGNEIDTYFDTHPEELDDWNTLLTQLVDLTTSKCPQILAGTVVTYHNALANNHLDWVKNYFGPRCDIIACTFYPEWMPKGYEPGKLDQQFSDIVSSYGGSWKLALIESGISADSFMGSSETKQATYMYEQLNAISNHSSDFEFASPMFAVFAIEWGSPPFSNWVAGVSVYRRDGTPRPIRDIIANNVTTSSTTP